MELMRAGQAEIDELIDLYHRVSDQMEQDGIHQWHWGIYPREDLLRDDLEKGNLYYLREQGEIAAAVVLQTGQEAEYEKLSWNCGVKPGIFHRLAVAPNHRREGLGALVMDDVLKLLRGLGCDCVRCDTSEHNVAALALYERLGFRPCDTLRWEDSAGNDLNIAMDKPLKRETPLWPIRMTPAFRGGKLTPWGGNRLRKEFGKETEEEQTGESLEVSCIPGLESRDPLGRTLPELIRSWGEKLAGRYAERPFPLLLKLIDARDKLSVQVHPGDAYAFDHEGGKLGKTEAWLILKTPEGGGELVYGIRPGTTLKALRSACEKGAAVEGLLNRVRVQPGDVCYIPSGCVHAIGEGILLYEIQQSSDITYRFYDWDRVGIDGTRRELHLEKALEVTDLKCAVKPVHVEKAEGIRRVLDETYFTLDVIRTSGAVLLPRPRDFAFLTALEGEPVLRWEGASLRMKEGETCFIPAMAPEMILEGPAALAMSGPAGEG